MALPSARLLGNDQGLVGTGGQGSGSSLGGHHVITGLSSHFVVVGNIAAAVHLLELAAGKVLKAGVGQFHADLVVVAAAVLVCIEGSRGGVVDVHGGHHAHLVALLGVQLLGNGLIGHIAGPGAHVDDTALGLVAGGNGSGRGSGVRAEGGAVVGGHAAHMGEAGEAQVGLGHSTVVVHGALVEPGGLDLGGAHAVADEQEDVFGLLQQAVLFLDLSGSLVGTGSVGGGCSGHDTQGRSHSAGLQKAAAGDLFVLHCNILSLDPA